MLIDKEKVLEEIERLMKSYDPSDPAFGPEGNMIRRPVYDILLFLKREFSDLPSPIEVERWIVHKDGVPRIICQDDESIFGYGGNDCHKYAIRRLEDKP